MRAFISGRSHNGPEYRQRTGDGDSIDDLVREYRTTHPECDTITVVITGTRLEPSVVTPNRFGFSFDA